MTGRELELTIPFSMVLTLTCPDCDHKVIDDEYEPLVIYECQCGEVFSRDSSANGRNQCPQCNKMAAKLSDRGCPECEVAEMEPSESYQCGLCEEEEVYDTSGLAEHIVSEHEFALAGLIEGVVG